MPNMIISASDKGKPRYKGNTHDLCAPAKKQIIDHFYDDSGKRNRRTVAYFGIEKDKPSSSDETKKNFSRKAKTFNPKD